MLQQTQVATALPYFERWMERFPNVETLAAAPEQEVLAAWQGLGYYRRCRNLAEGARIVAREGFPCEAEGWRRLPGIGAYTAGAIASIANGQPVAAVDGNVERVFARLNGCAETGARLNRAAREWAAKLVPREHPAEWNQALMEFGARHCTPRSPDCANCPLAGECEAHRGGTVDRLPVPAPRPPRIEFLWYVWVPVYEGRFGLKQIAEGQWWRGMWEFPRAESREALAALLDAESRASLGVVWHTVTRHRIQLDAEVVVCDAPAPDLRWIEPSGLSEIPLPSPQRKLAQRALAWLNGRPPEGSGSGEQI